MPELESDPTPFDVFLSHAHVDADWVRVLAENLARLGLTPYLDQWEIAAGDVLVHELDRGLRNAKSGVLVVSPEALGRPWVQEEYAALVQAAVEHGRRLIPVLYKDAELPPLLATRVWVDFRGLDGERYLDKVRELAKLLEGKAKGVPEGLGSELQLPPGSGVRAAGPIRRRLRLEAGRTTLLGGADGVSVPSPGHLPGTEERLWKLERTFARRSPEETLRDGGQARGSGRGSLHAAQLEAGTALATDFLAPPVLAALRGALRQAESTSSSLELAIEAAGELADLPWETLCLPAGDGPAEPLALHRRVQLYRTVAGEGATPEWQIPGPLRILVAIGSPDAQNARGELLDMEAELASLLEAVDPARVAGKALVRILEHGSVEAIHQALEAERYHVLHISCHAVPGVLVLEDAFGAEDRVSAERLWREAIPADRGVPLVVLAGCATARAEPGEGEKPPGPGLARNLLVHGVPAVLAMQRPVSDRYATRLGAAFYAQLAQSAVPEPHRALALARVSLEGARGEEPRPEELAEWSTPVLFLRTAGQEMSAAPRLYDPGAPFEEIQPSAEPVLRVEVVQRRVGDFVGRRGDRRRLLAALRDPQGSGAVIRGIGGLGKSTLAAEVAATLGGGGYLVASVFGETSPDGVLAEIGNQLFGLALAQGVDEKHTLRQLKQVLDRKDLEWADRLRVLMASVLQQVPLLFLLDNFEDNLDLPGDEQVRLRSAPLAEFLGAWLAQPGRSRLLFTCRYPVPLKPLVDHALGPLSPAETRKLLWRLPALDALQPQDKLRAYADVGGHPRALEYLDALLRGGEARFADVAAHLEGVLERKGITEPKAWIAERGTDLDQALAATVTLATGDVLLEHLLLSFADHPLAWPLLLGAAVFRVPVEEEALRWQVGEKVPDLPGKDAKTFPSVDPPAGYEASRQRLERAGLLAPVDDGAGASRFVVHRWTARSLAVLASPQELPEAHRRAALYWRWRGSTVSHKPSVYLEARFHHYQAGELDQAVLVTEWVCSQLETWGAYQREEQLLRETLAWLPERSERAAGFRHQLGIVARKRGSYDEALAWYRESLEIEEELGNRAGMASSYHELGNVSYLCGAYDEALEHYRKSLELKEKLGNRAGMASSYHQLGIVAEDRGSYDEALVWYRKSLEIEEELGHRAGMATSYHQLGNLSYVRGSYDEAQAWYRKSLEIHEKRGDRAGMADSYHQLGNLSYVRGLYDEAREHYRKSLAIHEELGNRARMASSFHQLGMVVEDLGSYDEALAWYRKSLEIKEELGDRAGMASTYHQLGIVAQDRGAYDESLEHYHKSLEIREELGDRTGIADSYHQLGMVAQLRGAYDEALAHYRKSLEIREELGNRSGIADSYGQLSIFYTTIDRPAEAVPYGIRCLVIYLELQSPHARIILRSLLRQRKKLGEALFRALVSEEVGADRATKVIALLDRFGEEEARPSS